MQTPTCPKCGDAIAPADVNVAKDVAFCRACSLASKLSGLSRTIPLDPNVDLNNPPPGAWYRSDGVQTVIGASCRSLGGAIGILALAAFWNGIVSIFVVFAFASSLSLLGVRVPDWMPQPTMNGERMSWGVTVCLWLFLTPFMLIGLGMFLGFATSIAGRVEIATNGSTGTLYGGVGPIGSRRRFEVSEVRSVRIQERPRQDNESDTCKTEITIDLIGDRVIDFGSDLPRERMHFVASALHAAVIGRSR